MTAPGHHQLSQTLRPRDSAFDMAFALGSELRWEIACGALQRPGEIDTNASSRVATPADVRAPGGSIFCDRRFGRVFVYCNTAQSYYAARGFRGMGRV